jgi:hypothetical protein
MIVGELMEELRKQKDFMNVFDIVLIGGRDGSQPEFRGIPMETIEQSFIPFRQQGGSLLFLHDVLYRGDALWNYYSTVLGLTRGWSSRYSTVVAVVNSPVVRRPFAFDGPITVTSTHASQALTSPGSVILWGECPNGPAPYYMEKARVGMVQMGHDLEVRRDDWRLLVNIVYHLAGF